jgi:small-conductance mechanosensitive channel
MSAFFTDHRATLVWTALIIVVTAAVIQLVVILLNQTRVGQHRLAAVIRRTQRSVKVVLLVLAVQIGFAWLGPTDGGWANPVQHALTIALIAAIVWVLCDLAFALEEMAAARLAASEASEDVRSRRARTQFSLLRRLAVALIVAIGVGSILMTFPAVDALGRGIFASAGLLSIVAGLAAQTTLTNVFAGIQLALSDALRVGDVVVADGNSGIVDEITLTYVVVHLWDDRRLILPCSFFVSEPYENWTRSGDRISGHILLDVDWSAPLAEMRAELDRVLAASPHWDQRRGSLSVGGAAGGMIQLRISLSAADTGGLFALQGEVREAMVRFLVEENPDALPRTRHIFRDHTP